MVNRVRSPVGSRGYPHRQCKETALHVGALCSSDLVRAQTPAINLPGGFYPHSAACGALVFLLPWMEVGGMYWGHPIPASCTEHLLPGLCWVRRLCTWSDSFLKSGTSGQFLPPPQERIIQVNELVLVKPLGSENKVYALKKNKTRRFPRGAANITWKSIRTCQLPIPFIFMQL